MLTHQLLGRFSQFYEQPSNNLTNFVLLLNYLITVGLRYVMLYVDFFRHMFNIGVDTIGATGVMGALIPPGGTGIMGKSTAIKTFVTNIVLPSNIFFVIHTVYNKNH